MTSPDAFVNFIDSAKTGIAQRIKQSPDSRIVIIFFICIPCILKLLNYYYAVQQQVVILQYIDKKTESTHKSTDFILIVYKIIFGLITNNPCY
jgi:hypothetical protein